MKLLAHTTSKFNGTLVSVLSSVLFGAIYFVTPKLHPLGGIQIWAVRVVIAIPIVFLILWMLRQVTLFTDILHRIKKRPLLILPLIASSFLLATQLWLFSWAPLNDSGLEVALGYFLLPLVLVVVGRFLYKDKLEWWHIAAALVAAIGVAYQIFMVGKISWETLVVCLGYPVYFVLRRTLNTSSIGGMLFDFMLASPFAIFFLARELISGTAFQNNSNLFWIAPAFALFGAVALIFYILASRLLPMSLFGLLSYLEPALLIVAAMLIGESIKQDEIFTYAAIWLAVLILVLGGLYDFFKRKRITL